MHVRLGPCASADPGSERVCALEIQGQFAFADAKDVAVRIGQPRHNSFAAEINAARSTSLMFFRVGIRPDKNNPVAFHRDRFRMRLALVHCVDVAVNKNGLDRFDGAHRGSES